MSDKKGSTAGKFALGAVLGAAVGAAVGLLTAPKSGKETREDIKNKATEVKGKASDAADSFREEAGKRGAEFKHKADRKIGDTKKFLRREKGHVEDFVEDELDDDDED